MVSSHGSPSPGDAAVTRRAPRSDAPPRDAAGRRSRRLPSLRARIHASMLLGTASVITITWAASEFWNAGQADPVAFRRGLLVFASALALLSTAVVAEWLTRGIETPLDELRRTAAALSRGDFTVRARTRRTDVLGALARSVDAMADQLAERLAAVNAQEGRLRVMLDAMDEAVLVTDAEGRIVLTNTAFQRLTGGSGLGRTVVEALRSGELHDAVRSAADGRSAKAVFEVEAAREAHVLSAHVAPLPARAGVIAVLHDITEVHRTDAVRRDFVANASHELRTPLTAIRGFAETLLDGALDEPRVARRFVGNIVENSKRLSRLVDDLLALSRAESPEMQYALEPVDPAHVATKVLAALEGKASDKGIAVALEGTGDARPVLADEGALDQVLMNLVENGIKYTPSGGRVTVGFVRGAEGMAIEVRDTGPGIGASHLPRIFERFYRVDAGRSRHLGGTGLGLAIVKHLVQRMNGEVSVESPPREGTIFRVRLLDAEPREGRTSSPG